jgi:alkylhydroperoxidase family enzyme
MSEVVTRLRKAVVERALQGKGEAKGDTRRAAFDFDNTNVPEAARALIEKVTKNAWRVTDEDVAAVKKAGLSEDEIFELCVCAALGQSTRQLDAALAALDEACKDGKR